MDVWFLVQSGAALAVGFALIALVLAGRHGAKHGAAGGGLDPDALAIPVWSVDVTGLVTARNAACRTLGEALPAAAGRVEIASHWYEVMAQQSGGGRMFAAVPMDAAVRAESALRDFRNTMGDTFAQLALGLGLFDAAGRLQMFNPAFGELAGVPVDFLLRRPHLGALLDALRDRGMLPEPKDWRGWRQMMLELPSGSTTYEEVWGLAGGVTYRATLRPQAKGAFALLLEDISTEMSRSQRYRADMELSQAVIDTLDEAIAVFAGTGQLVLSNAAYAELWGHDPGAMIGEGSIRRIAAHWREVSAPTPLWSEIEEFIGTTGLRDGWRAEARLRDGRLIACRIAPIREGATLAAFRPVLPDGALPERAAVLRYQDIRAG
ncbi:PAS domain-containing protein [Paragemmobacter straminiformis]|uniref:PAS-domain containing protein n=1 Tax=Paragemmobacter straminiformis TaxID=2045119 RepID=A0A842IAK4_9RHOB|nr:PAS-domain containing protein [Gemmobacter straminiformis]MBC2836018.1 PAS-domain containing protein [Gemmobacter straminiformis]